MSLPDTTALHDVLIAAVDTAGLSVEDQAVVRAEGLLSEQYFLNAASLRFKRRKSGSWQWLLESPFSLPICLAELIADVLDKSENDTVDFPTPKKQGDKYARLQLSSVMGAMQDSRQPPIIIRIPHSCVDTQPNQAAFNLPHVTPDKRKRPSDSLDSTRPASAGRPYKDLSSGRGLLQLSGQPVHVSQEVPIEFQHLNTELGSYHVVDPPMSTVFVPIQLTIRLIAESLTASNSLLAPEASALPHLMVQMGQRCRSKKSIVRLRVAKTSTTGAGTGTNSRTWDHVVCCSVEDVLSAFKYAFFEANLEIPDFTSFIKSINMPVDKVSAPFSPCSDVFLRRRQSYGAGGVHIPVSMPSASGVPNCLLPEDAAVNSPDRQPNGFAAESSSEDEPDFADLKNRSDSDTDSDDENRYMSTSMAAPLNEIKGEVPMHTNPLPIHPNVIAAAKAASAAATPKS